LNCSLGPNSREAQTHLFRNIRSAGSGEARADCANLVRRTFSSGDGARCGHLQSGARGVKTNAEWIRRPRLPFPGNLPIGIERDALCLGAATIKAEKNVHRVNRVLARKTGQQKSAGLKRKTNALEPLTL
jgi:hypothetical protein